MTRYLKQKLFKNVGKKMAFFSPGSIPSIRMLREKKGGHDITEINGIFCTQQC